jgi:hypothetical protein
MATTKAARTLSRPRIFTLHETADRLRPAEAFLDALAQSLPPGLKPRGRLAATSLGTAVLRAGPMLARRPVDRGVWLNPPPLQPLDEGLGVVALAGAQPRPLGQALAHARRRLALGRSGRQRRLGRRRQPVAVLHQDVAKIGETALLPGAFAVKARILVRRRGVRRVRPLGLAEVGLAVAPRL